MTRRPYGRGTNSDVWMQHEVAGSSALATSTEWTPAAGDVKVSKDGAANANIGTLPVYDADALAWKYVFTDAELQARVLSVSIRDAALKDDQFFIETEDHESAQHPQGVIKHLTLATVTSTTFTATDAVADNGTQPATALGARYIAGIAIIIASDVAEDVNCALLLTAYSKAASTGTYTGASGWNRTPTGTATTIRLNVYSGAQGFVSKMGTQAVADVFARAQGAAFGNRDFEGLVQDIAALLFGRTTGAGTASEVFRTPDDSAARVTVGNDGANRTSVTQA